MARNAMWLEILCGWKHYVAAHSTWLPTLHGWELYVALGSHEFVNPYMSKF